jgi:5-(carboxyamino)imidazole ribonucleotide synthase
MVRMSRNTYPEPLRVGMVGAGQLARMTHQAAIDLGVRLEVLADHEDDPAVQAGARRAIGRAVSIDDVRSLAARNDVITFDHEGVPREVVETLEAEGFLVHPGARALRLVQDKLLARRVLSEAGFPVPGFVGLGPDPESQVRGMAERWGWPLVLKVRSGGYDGRGVVIVGEDDVAPVLDGSATATWMAEEYVDIDRELAIVGVRSASGDWASYPVVETRQVDGICRELVMPARIPDALASEAAATAKGIADGIDAIGIIAVEFFVTRNGTLLVNELALRPHNSGHATIEACVTSQFENHLRAVLGLPLGATELISPVAAMVNVLGPADGSDPRTRLRDALTVRGARIHLYDKAPIPGRKLGHVTALGTDPETALAVARRCAELLQGLSRKDDIGGGSLCGQVAGV